MKASNGPAGNSPGAAGAEREHGGPTLSRQRTLTINGMTSDDRPRVFVSRRISDESLERIVSQANADVWPDDMPPGRDELLRRVEGVDGLLSKVSDRVYAELLERAGPGLKVVRNY